MPTTQGDSFLKNGKNLAALQLSAHRHIALSVHTVDLETDLAILILPH